MFKKIFYLSELPIESSFIVIFSIISLVILDLIGLGLFFIFIKNYITDQQFLIESSIIFFNLNSLKIFDFLLLISFVYFIRFILTIGLNFFITKFSQIEQYKLKIKLLRKLTSFDIRSINNLHTSKVLNIFSNHISHYGNSLESLFRLMADLLLLLFITIFLLFINFKIVLMAIGILLSSLLLIKKTILNRTIIYGKEYNDSLNSQLVKIKDYLTGIQILKLFNFENKFLNEIDSYAKAIYINNFKRNFLNSIPRQIFELIIIIFILFSVGFLIFYFSKEEMISTIGIFVISLPRFIPTLNSIVINLNNIKFGNAAVNEIDYLMNNTVSSKLTQNTIIEDFKKIEFSNVQFKILNRKKILFAVDSFIINKSDVIGLIGKSGSGKTTLINTIIGHVRSYSTGNIKIDGINFDQKKSFMLNNVSLVPQDSFIFNGSLIENITFEKNIKNIDKNRLNESLMFAQLINFYNDNKNKIISDNGLNLSGGQKQRINIARAFYHNKNFLIFDEPTSALDEVTEKELISILLKIKKRFTIIIISHRKQILSVCNKIFKIDENKLIIKKNI